MSIGIVSDEDFLKELNHITPSRIRVPSPVHTPEVLEKETPSTTPTRGRGIGSVGVPESLQKIIGEESVINGRASALELAAQFGISASSVSAYSKGATSTATINTPKPAILEHINKSRRRSIKRASEVLNSALSAITQDKLDYTDARDLSGIAKDMSAIIKNLEPPSDAMSALEGRGPQFVVYAPTFRDERSFDTITVTE
jgi:hypothetical protein